MDGSKALSPISSQVATHAEEIDFRALFDAHFSYVWGTLRRLGVRQADLEDVTHEVFLQVFRRLSDFDRSRPIRPWLFGFAYRTAADERRRARHRREVIGTEDNGVDERAPADERLAASQDHSLVHAALLMIDLDRRAVLVLHEIDGLPVPEVANVLSIPLNTAYSRLRVGREELAAAVKRLMARRSTP